MDIKEAVRALDEAIPAPSDNMVDRAHLDIAVAWDTVRGLLSDDVIEGMSELDKLELYLTTHGYDYERTDRTASDYRDKHQIIVYRHGVRSWDVVCHKGSYGYEKGLLETYGEIVSVGDNMGDSVEGWLTADEVIERIERLKSWVDKRERVPYTEKGVTL